MSTPPPNPNPKNLQHAFFIKVTYQGLSSPTGGGQITLFATGPNYPLPQGASIFSPVLFKQLDPTNTLSFSLVPNTNQQSGAPATPGQDFGNLPVTNGCSIDVHFQKGTPTPTEEIVQFTIADVTQGGDFDTATDGDMGSITPL